MRRFGDLSAGSIQPSTWWGIPIVAGEAGAGLLAQKLHGVTMPSTGFSAKIHRGTKMEDFDDPTHGGAARSGGGFKGARNVEGGHTRFQRVFKHDKKGRY